MSNFKNYWLKGRKIESSKQYQLVVREAKTAGLVFQELESIGISNISISKLNHSDIEEFRKEVKVNAIRAAKEKANSLANAIGQTIGKAIYIQELNYDHYYGQRNAVSNIVVAAQDFSNKKMGVEFEKIKLEYSILARFELK